MDVNEITSVIIGSAIEVHRNLGQGLLESAYEDCLVYELRKPGFIIETQVPIPIIYKEIKLECGYRADIIVNRQVIIELKSVEQINPVHEAQILTYMKFSGLSIGLLINFNVLRLKDGIRRFIR